MILDGVFELLCCFLEFLARFEWFWDHWRLSLCAFAGSGAAIWIWAASPSEWITHAAAVTALLTGIWIGSLWDRV